MKENDICSDMKDFYLQMLVDFYWREDNNEKARFDCFEYLIQEYRLDHISLEEFNLLFNLSLQMSRYYEL